MKVLLFIIAGLTGFGAFMVTANAKGAIHEIYGAVLFLSCMVSLAGGSIIASVDDAAAALKAELERVRSPADHP